MNTVVKQLVLALLCVSFFALSAQAETKVTTKTIGHGSYSVSIPSDFQSVGQLSVSVPLNSEVSGRFPHSSMNSKVYTNGKTILFVQRMSAPVSNNYFKPLSGTNVAKWGKNWLKNSYSMNVANTTQEFDQYNNFIKQHSLTEASDYTVEMFDHLVSPTSIIRVLTFTPQGTTNLPAVPKASNRYYVEVNK